MLSFNITFLSCPRGRKPLNQVSRCNLNRLLTGSVWGCKCPTPTQGCRANKGMGYDRNAAALFLLQDVSTFFRHGMHGRRCLFAKACWLWAENPSSYKPILSRWQWWRCGVWHYLHNSLRCARRKARSTRGSLQTV